MVDLRAAFGRGLILAGKAIRCVSWGGCYINLKFLAGGCMANLPRLILLFYSPFVWATIETIPATFTPVAVLVSYGGTHLATPELECQRMVTETAPWIYVSTGTVTAEYVQCFAKLPYDASPVFFGGARIHRRCDISWSSWAPVSSLDCGTVYSCPATGGWTLSGSFCTRDVACPVGKLAAPPFNDACAQALENVSSTQAQKNAACGSLTPAMQAGKSCLEGKLSSMSPAISLAITADIRSIAYQAHLKEIWDKMQVLVRLMKEDPAMQTACAARRAEIAAEKGCDNAGVCTSCYPSTATRRSHCIAGMPASPNPNDAQHTQGKAFDVSRTRTINPLRAALGARNPPQAIQQFLDAPPTNCNLNWGGTFKDNYDPVHFYAR